MFFNTNVRSGFSQTQNKLIIYFFQPIVRELNYVGYLVNFCIYLYSLGYLRFVNLNILGVYKTDILLCVN